ANREILVKAETLCHVADALLDLGCLRANVEAEAGAFAGVRRQQSAEHADRCGLAAAIGAEKSHDDAARHFDIEIVDDRLVAEPLGQAVHADGRRRAVHGCTSSTSTGWPTCSVSARSFGRASTMKTRRERSSRL